MYSVENTLNYVTVQKHKRICDSVGNTQEFVTVQETPNYIFVTMQKTPENLLQCRKHPRICYSVGKTQEFAAVTVGNPQNLLQCIGNIQEFVTVRKHHKFFVIAPEKKREYVAVYSKPKNQVEQKNTRTCTTVLQCRNTKELVKVWETPKNVLHIVENTQELLCNCIETPENL